MTTVAAAVARELARAGVDRIFGLPGGEVLYVLDAARREGIDFALTRHEATAGFAAAVYGKLKGVPGVALSTLGPGAANLVLPVANATLDREPLLALTAQLPHSHPETHTHQKLRLSELYGPITKLTQRLDPSRPADQTRWALQLASAEPMGAVHLSLSASDALEEAGGATAARASFMRADDIDEFLTPLTRAERPVLLLGLGLASHPDLAPRLNHLVQERGLPTLVTPKVKGIIDEDQEAFCGVAGGMGADDLMLELLQAADLIVGLGFDPVEVDKTWHAELPVLYLLEAPNVYDIIPEHSVRGPLDRFVDAWLDAPPAPHQWTVEDGLIRDLKDRYNKRLVEQPADGIWPGTVVQVLREVLPDEAIVTTDVGSHKFLFGQFWRAHKPQTFFMSNGLSGMGYGLPSAIGAKLARPEVPVMAVVGDGGFAMSSQELETINRLGAPLVVIVMADNALSLIKLSQEKKKLQNYGVDFGRMDPVKVAEACGIEGVRTGTASELQAAVSRAVNDGTALVAEVPVDYRAYRRIF